MRQKGGWETERGGEVRVLSLSTSFCPHPLCYILTVVFSLNLSPQSSVQTAISGHPVTIATLATLGHRAAGAHSGMSLILSFSLPPFSLPSVSSVPIWSCSFSLSVLGPNVEKTVSLCFFTPPSPCDLVYPSLYVSLFCLLHVSHCLSLCLSRDILQHGVRKIGSPTSHVEYLVAKHIKALCRHICQS